MGTNVFKKLTNKASILLVLFVILSTPVMAGEAPPFIALNYNYSTINFTNWNEPQNRHWSWWNLDKIIPFCVEIGKGHTSTHQFGTDKKDLSGVRVNYYGREMSLEEYLIYSRTDGFLVIKNNKIIYEAYPRQMHQNDRHGVMSSSKSFIAAAIGNLVESGKINTADPIEKYIPDVGEGYTGETLQDALDMNVAVQWSEDYSDPKAEGIEIFKAEAMHPGYEAWRGGARDFLRGLKKGGNPIDGNTHYYTSNSSILGWVISNVTGLPWNRYAQIAIWEKIGAEQNALNFEDATGYGQSSGSFVMTLRDFARFAQIFAGEGVAGNGNKIFSKQWFNTIVKNPNATKYYHGATNSNWWYTHQLIINKKGGMGHLGYGGQFWYANHKTGVVIVKMSTLDNFAAADKDTAVTTMNIVEIIDDKISK